MDRQPVRSSNIRSVGYDTENLTLELAFYDGSVYRYSGVPDAIWIALMRADSKGSYFHEYIKDRYPFWQVR